MMRMDCAVIVCPSSRRKYMVGKSVSARPKESRGREHAPDPTVETWLLSCLFFYGVQAAYSVTLGIGAGCAFLMRSGVQ